MPPGDIRERIEKISRREHNELIGFIRQYTKSSFIAEEILQEAYLEALKHADQIKKPDRLISWLKTVAKRLAMAEINKYNLLIKKCKRLIDTTWVNWEDDLLEQILISDIVNKVLQNFPPYYRKVIHYRYTYNMPYAHIAKELGISVSAARKANSRVIRRIREEWGNNHL